MGMNFNLSPAQINANIASYKADQGSGGTPMTGTPNNAPISPGLATNAKGAAVAGFNHGVEGMTHGVAQTAMELTSPGGGAALEPALKTYEQNRMAEYQQIANQHPTAFGAGNVAGTIAGAAPLSMIPGAGTGVAKIASQGMEQGAAYGASQYSDTGVTGKASTVATDAAIGVPTNMAGAVVSKALTAAIGGGASTVGWATGKVQSLGKGVVLALKDPNKIVDAAIVNTAAKIGGDLTKANPTDFLQVFKDTVKPIATQAVQGIEDAKTAATKAGITVQRTTVSQLLQTAMSDKSEIGTTGDSQLISEAKAALGDNPSASIPYNKVVTGIQKLGKDAYKASDNGVKAAILKVKDALQTDLDAAITKSGNPQLIKQLQDANSFYSTKFGPFKDVINKTGLPDPSEPDTANALDNFVNGKFQAGFMKGLKTDPAFVKVYGALPEQAQRNLSLSNIQVIKAASTVDGQINISTMSHKLQQAALKDKTENGGVLYGQVPNQFQALVDTLNAKAGATQAMRVNLKEGSLGTAAMIAGMFGAPVAGAVAGGAILANKAWFLASAGEALGNAELRGTLSELSKVSKTTVAPQVIESLQDKVWKAFSGIAAKNKIPNQV